MRLVELLSGIEYSSTVDVAKIDFDVKRIISNSKNAREGDIFVAIKGRYFDGHDFLDDVASKGVDVVVVEEATLTKRNVVQIKIRNTRQAISILARNFYRDPSKNIKLIGITGTNGKTTVSYLLDSVLKKAGNKTGLIGTINYKIDDKIIDAKYTTPDILVLNKLLETMVSQSIPYGIMEVSSHGLDQGRVENIKFRAAVFTNLSHEHLDYHKTVEEYLKTKLKLFENLYGDAYAVINRDSPYFDDLISCIDADFITYGMEEDADIMIRDLKMHLNGSKFYISTPKDTFDIRTPLIGKHNIYNILAASSVAIKEGIDLQIIKRGIEALSLIPGRMEAINAGQDFNVFVDYAHTEDALRNVLSMLRQLTKDKIVLVFGCGGDRDRTKRPNMGKVAAELADFTIITTDNPRSEDPREIAKEIEEGFKGLPSRYAIVLDRFEAIKKALSAADEDTTVLIAGKGHEKSQFYKDYIIPFDDSEVARLMLERLT